MTEAELEAQLALITEQLKELEEAKRQKTREAANAFVLEYDYKVTWPHPAQFRIGREITDACAARLEEFIAVYGEAAAPKPFVGGMTYSLLEGGYILSGGGSVVVNFPQRQSFAPFPIAPDIVASLRKGLVPDCIKRA